MLSASSQARSPLLLRRQARRVGGDPAELGRELEAAEVLSCGQIGIGGVGAFGTRQAGAAAGRSRRLRLPAGRVRLVVLVVAAHPELGRVPLVAAARGAVDSGGDDRFFQIDIDFVRLLVEFDENVSFFHAVVVIDEYFHHLSGHAGGHEGNVAVDIRVVGGNGVEHSLDGGERKCSRGQ